MRVDADGNSSAILGRYQDGQDSRARAGIYFPAAGLAFSRRAGNRSTGRIRGDRGAGRENSHSRNGKSSDGDTVNSKENKAEPGLPAEAVRATLKWFNGQKGFGFVVPENHKADAFLHITTLKRAQVDALGEGACLLCLMERNERGVLVREVVSVIDAGRAPQPVDRAGDHAG